MLGIEMHMNSFKGANSGHIGLTKWYIKPVCPYIQKNFLELVTESYTVQSSLDKKKKKVTRTTFLQKPELLELDFFRYTNN